MQKGFVFVFALAFLVFAVILTSIFLQRGAQAGAEASLAREKGLSLQAAERGARIATERLGQMAARSYFSDPVESYFWFGGDLPNDFRTLNPGSADGILATDGEVLGEDYGPDALPNILEPGFHLDGEIAPSGWNFLPELDPNGDDFALASGDRNFAAAELRTEGNSRYDLPLFNTANPQAKPQLLGVPVGLPGQMQRTPVLQKLGFGDRALGADGISSFRETGNRFPLLGIDGSNPSPRLYPYSPIAHSDPAGDDYHPIFNPRGEEGRVRSLGWTGGAGDPGSYGGPTVENPEIRWRRYVQRLGPLEVSREENQTTAQAYCSVRAVDTASKLDLNGPSLLTARLLNSLTQMMGSSPGPIAVRNPPIGRNGRGFETGRALQIVYPSFVQPVESPLDYPQYLLFPNPAFEKMRPINTAVDADVPLPIRKMASTQAEEKSYFQQPLNANDCDAVAVIKHRDQQLGGKFSSVEQLLEVRRMDGSAIFDERNRDELLRLSQFLSLEGWKDPDAISHRNAEPMGFALNPNTAAAFQWSWWADRYLDPEPWQDIWKDGVCELGEEFDDAGFDSEDSFSLLSWSLQFPGRPDVFAGGTSAQISIASGFVMTIANPPVADADFIHLQIHLNANDRGHVRIRLVHEYTLPGETNARQDSSGWVWNRQGGWDVDEIDQTFQVDPRAFQANPDVSGLWKLQVEMENPNEWESHFDSVWNPFFLRQFSGRNRLWRVESGRGKLSGWSPFSDRFYSRHPLPHRHASYNFPFVDEPHSLDEDPLLFNFDASSGNGVFDVDPYVCAFEPIAAERDFMLCEFPSSTGLEWPSFFTDPGLDRWKSQSTGDREHFKYFQYQVQNPRSAYSRDPAQDDLAVAAILGGSQLCGSEVSLIWRMGNAFGTEANGRMDPYPDLGRVWRDSGFRWHFDEDLPAAFQGRDLYQPASDPELPGLNFVFQGDRFLRPNFSELPRVDNPFGAENRMLVPPVWAKTAGSWFAKPGEPFLDDGRDGIPNTGDFGEGNGRWDPGELFDDFGLDGLPNRLEQAFQDSGFSAVLNNCELMGAEPGNAGDLHGDDFQILRGVPAGSEGNGIFDLIREPFLDIYGDGNWQCSSIAGLPESEFPFESLYFDLNGNGAFDSGIYREPRAPVNLNSAPEEVLASVVYQGILFPTKVRQDRFTWTSWDFPSSYEAPREDFEWSSVVQRPGERVSDPDFAYNLARGFSRAVFLRRLGLYLDSSGNPIPGIGAGAFRSWGEFEDFVRVLISSPRETARFSALATDTIQPNSLDPAGKALRDPFSLAGVASYPAENAFGYPGGDAGARQLAIDRILVQANPNSRISALGNAPWKQPTRVEKTDFPFPTTEFSLGPTGVYEIQSVGYLLHEEAGGVPSALPSEKTEIIQTVRVFEPLRIAGREGFEQSETMRRGVSILPVDSSDLAVTGESSVTLRELSGPSDAGEPFLWIKPKVECLDSEKGLLFIASNSDKGPRDPDDPGAAIQVVELSVPAQNSLQASVRNYPRNNGLAFTANRDGRSYSFAVIEPGNGFFPASLSSAPQISAMCFDPKFPEPGSFSLLGQYLGRLYLMDDRSQALRAVDVGRDASGGLVSQEILFSRTPVYPGSGVKIISLPEERALYLLSKDGGETRLARFRYAETSRYPALDTNGSPILRPVDELRFPEMGEFIGLVYDPVSKTLYLGGSEMAGSRLGLYAIPISGALASRPLFPYAFSLPGYSAVQNLDLSVNRELVGLEIDPGSGLLFALWNCTNPGNADSHGVGAYLAAFPVGSAPYLSVALANPFPMELTVRDARNSAARDDFNPILASAFSLDPKNQTALVVPREQLCDAGNPYASSKNVFRVLSYAGDGLRLVDLMQNHRIWTDLDSFTLGEPERVSIDSIAGKNLFLLSVAVPQVTDFIRAKRHYGEAPECDTPRNPPWRVTRSIRLLQIEGFPFQTGRSKAGWEEGKLSLSHNAAPLSEYTAASGEFPIHSRASFDRSRFFDRPQFQLDSTAGLGEPLGLRSSFTTRASASLSGTGLFIDGESPSRNTTGARQCGASPPVQRGNFQGHFYPQEPAGEAFDVSRALESGTEFWVRFGDLSQFVPEGGKQLVLYENSTKIKVDLNQPNPFLPGDRNRSLLNILKAGENELRHAPNIPSGQSVASFEFCPDSIELWVYDKIVLESFQRLGVGEFRAQLGYERRLAGPAGQYPSIFHDWPGGEQLTTPWGAFEGCPGFNDPSLSFYSSSQYASLNAPKGSLLDNADEAKKYIRVRVRWSGGGVTEHRFVPVWVHGALPSGRQAAVKLSIPDIPLSSQGWSRIAFASRVDFDPSNPATALLKPSTGAGGTVLRVWTTEGFRSAGDADGETLAISSSVAEDPINNPSWWDFRGEKEGFLSCGAYYQPYSQTQSDGSICHDRIQGFRAGGPVVPGFSYAIDDLVLYENPDPVVDIPSSPQATGSMARFETGEGNWPVSGAAAPAYLPPEPFYDFNENGSRDLNPRFLDRNANGRWDFGESRALAGEVVPASNRYGEPYADLDGNGWSNAGEMFSDLNLNGFWDPGELFLDSDGNGVCDARLGEPYVNNFALAPGLGYDPGADTFFDENLNGTWDSGEAFTSWSRVAGVSGNPASGPQNGELYRENQLVPGLESGTGLSPADDWNQNGRYEPAGFFEGEFPEGISAGSRIGSLHFSSWTPGPASSSGRVSVDLEFKAIDGRSLGRWTGVDGVASDDSLEIVPVDESGIGLTLPADARVSFRVNFFLPNSCYGGGSSENLVASPVLDDLTLTVIPALQNQAILHTQVARPLLSLDYERGKVMQ